MPLIIPQPSASAANTYVPVPADNHVGVCIGVIDLGTHHEGFQGGPPKPQHKVKLVFELPDVAREDGTTATISKTFNLSMHEKSTFRKTLENWLGAGQAAALVGKSFDGLLEWPAMVNVEQTETKDSPPRTISYIAGLSKIPARMSAPAPTRSTFLLDLDEKVLPAELSLRDAETIRLSDEYKVGGFKDEAPRPGQQGMSNRPDAAVRFVPTAEFDETGSK